jgi:hypothetical protein
MGEEEYRRGVRRRSQPPSRWWVLAERGCDGGVEGDGGEMRRQRSFPNLYEARKGMRDSGAEENRREAEAMQGAKSGALAVQEV